MFRSCRQEESLEVRRIGRGIWTSDTVGELGDVRGEMEDESRLVEEEAEGVDEGATTEKCRNA